ncbi:protease modulator HflC [Methylovirgula sp. HY1]|uniref:protease modulator HflC n=1 Tax=Methylovirgula sp. HY1 TaxID=2822761 RepID=UPI001C5AB8DE|nr:protease modulator HflC [Methylovirgula sp. HY1]QXX76193.1 Modulator of FtsH protease HflC [Methylovirgula sp. HY1]
MKQRAFFAIAALGVALFTALSACYTVSEGQRALVVRLGAPIAVIDTPGFRLKLPFIDTIIVYDARLLLLEPPTEEVILGDQKRIVAQTSTRFRIVDPLRFYRSLRTLEQASSQLALVVSSALRREFGQIDLHALLSSDREWVIRNIQHDVAEKFHPYGVDVVEVLLHRADLPVETSQAIYDRMKSERQREAKELRAQGFEWAQRIQAQADRERTIILSEAQRDARIAHGEGDAQANLVLGKAVNRDPQFYKFYRALQSYRRALAASSPTIILSPDMEFLKLFKAGPQAKDMTGGAERSRTEASKGN